MAVAVDVKTFIPTACQQVVPYVSTESARLMPRYDQVPYFSALIEHESCITLTHKKCCSPKSQLITAREHGAGLGMLTKAYKADGTVRFDTLTALRDKHKQELMELSWGNITSRPDLQVRAMLLLFKGDYDRLTPVKSTYERTKMADSAYNGGIQPVLKARIACGLAEGCNNQQWFNHTERYLSKSTKALYAGRSAKDINLHHVRDTTVTRLPKYQSHFKEIASERSRSTGPCAPGVAK